MIGFWTRFFVESELTASGLCRRVRAGSKRSLKVEMSVAPGMACSRLS